MIMWGLADLWKQGREGGYSVRHGTRPVRDFAHPLPNRDLAESINGDNENFFEKAFPSLYPYGRGGLEAGKPNAISFREHIRWSLQYFDRRFRKHESFSFVAFGIVQRREALGAVRVQMRRKNFEREAQLMSTITAERLQAARQEEQQGGQTSDPVVRLLKKHVYASSSKVVGSDQSRYLLRSQIWSTTVMLGPPSLWMTINPSDLHDPIVQIFAGEEVDMDRFASNFGPGKDKRAKNVADDPYAAAEYFHFMVRLIFRTLFGVTVTQYQVKSRVGVLGPVSAYFGPVESQGRGTLHLHLLLWLQNAPSADEMRVLLTTEEFRNKVVAFIRANIRAYLPGLDSAKSVKAIPRDPELAFSRLPDPSSPEYDDELQRSELRLARSEQIHTCKRGRCLCPDKHGVLRCKRKAPFDCAPDDFVLPNGKWGPKRLYEYTNGWHPSILLYVRCNNDAKFLTNGSDTKNITFYITSYATKKQGKCFNLSTVLSQAYAYHMNHLDQKYIDSLRDSQRMLLLRIVHAINREQEISAPMVISYLMGWGDVYKSHNYAPVYWSSFVGALLKYYPTLKRTTR
jgi:hypothetical protein